MYGFFVGYYMSEIEVTAKKESPRSITIRLISQRAAQTHCSMRSPGEPSSNSPRPSQT